MTACDICGRTGQPPEQEIARVPNGGPWLLLQATMLRKRGDSDNTPDKRVIVCSRTCAIRWVTGLDVRDVDTGGRAP